MATNERTKNRIAEGGRQISALLNKEEAALLARMEQRHGGVKATIVAALKALEGANELTNEELLSTLRARLNAAQAGKTSNSVKENLHDRKIIMPPKR